MKYIKKEDISFRIQLKCHILREAFPDICLLWLPQSVAHDSPNTSWFPVYLPPVEYKIHESGLCSPLDLQGLRQCLAYRKRQLNIC